MAIGDDFSVTVGGDIRHDSGTATYTVLELHRWLQDLADDASASGNDLIDITSGTPSDRSTDQIITLNSPYNIDDDAAEYLYAGSISQGSGDTLYSGLLVVGSVFGSTTLQIVQNDALYDTDSPFWGATDANYTGLNGNAATNTLQRTLVKTRADGVDIDEKRVRVYAREWSHTWAEFGVTLGLGEGTAAIFTNDDLNNTTLEATVSGWTTIVNNLEGYQTIDLNNGNGAQPYYSEWDRDTYTINQYYERCKWLARRGTSSTQHAMDAELFRGITHEWAYDAEAGGNPATNDDYAWGTALAYDNEAVSTFQVGEAIHEDTATPVWKARILAVDDNGTTGTLIVRVESGTITDNETFTAQTSGTTADVAGTPTAVTGGGLFRILAVNDAGTTGTVWVQLLNGTPPSDDDVCYDDTDAAKTITVNGSITSRPIKPVWMGDSTGSAIIGAFGLGVESADLTNNDLLTDLLNATQAPPNNVTFTVSGLVSGEDRVLLAPETGGGIDTTQMTLNTTLNGATETTIDVGTGNIPTGIPQTGNLRVVLDDGRHRLIAYTSHDSDDEFTIGSSDWTDPDDATAGNGVYQAMIDKLATGTSEVYTQVYPAGDVAVFARVRDGAGTPIKTFESPGTIGTAGGSVTAIRQSDA